MTPIDPTSVPNEPPLSRKDSQRANLQHVDLDFSFNPLARDIHIYENKIAPIGENWVEIDSDNSSKLFTSPAPTFHHVMKLPDRAKALLLWILYKLEYNTDLIEISESRVSKDFGLKGNTFRKAITDLIEAKVIARVADAGRSLPETKQRDYWLFWINPHVMFKGSRFSFYRKNAVPNRDNLLTPEEQSKPFPPRQ